MCTPKIGYPGQPDQHNLRLPELLANELGDLDAVERHAFDRDARMKRPRLAECLSGPALIPFDEREVSGPAKEKVSGNGALGEARPTVQDQQHRVPSILATNDDELFDSADPGEQRLVDPGCLVDGRGPRNLAMPVCAVGKTAAGHQEDEPQETQQSDLRSLPDAPLHATPMCSYVDGRRRFLWKDPLAS